MAIALGSIATGLPKDIVQQVMRAERVPVERLAERKERLAAQRDLVAELEGLVQGLKGELVRNGNARSLREVMVETNEDLIGVTADKNVVETGSHQIEVVRLARRSSAISSGFADKDESDVGVGFIRYRLPDGSSRNVYVGAGDSTLTGVARVINAADDMGMRAMVVNDGSGSDAPWRLIMTLKETGDGRRAEFPHLYFVDGERDFFLEHEREARDALIKIDGFEIETPGNKIADVIPGLTIDLKDASPGKEFPLLVSEDVEAVSDKVAALVEGVNGVLSFIKTQNDLDADTDTSRTLGGDSLLQSLEGRLRNVVFTPVRTDRGDMRASDVGIAFTREGTLSFDANAFNARMAEDYRTISQFLTGRVGRRGPTPGLIQNLMGFADDALMGPDGVIPMRKRGFRSGMERIDRRIEQRERILARKEQALKDKFSRLEGTMARLRAQGAGVAALGQPAPNPALRPG